MKHESHEPENNSAKNSEEKISDYDGENLIDERLAEDIEYARRKQSSSKDEVEEEEKNDKGDKKDWILFISIAIIVVCIVAVLLVIKYTNNNGPTIETYEYRGFEFRKLGDLWYFDIQPQPDKLVHVPIHFIPRDVQNISVVGELDNEKFNKPEIYITFDPGDDKELKFTALAAGELGLSMAQGILAVPIAACTKNETEACASRPIKDCSSNDSVIYLKISDTPKVTMNNTCVVVEGKDYDLVRSTDRLLLWWYSVMRD